MHSSVEVDLGGGRIITIETGKMAKQANGSVIVRSGESVVLVTACTAPEPKVGASFFPLTVDYREYTYSAGRFPGGFIKREGRPTEKEVLTSRLIDRPIRPLFPEGYSHETQVIGMVLSADPLRATLPRSPLSVRARRWRFQTSRSITCWRPVRVGMIDGKLIANPTYEETKSAKINIVVAGTEEGIVMVESGAQQASEAEVLDAIEFGHKCCKKIAAATFVIWLPRSARRRPRTRRRPSTSALYDQISKAVATDLKDARSTLEKYEKLESYSRVAECKHKAIDALAEEQKAEGKKLFDALKETIFRDEMLKDRRRPDGRAFDQVRKIDIEIERARRAPTARRSSRAERPRAWSRPRSGPRTMSSALSCSIPPSLPSASCCTTTSRRSASAQVGFMRGAGRREIGHGALAERVPFPPSFPTIKLSPLYTMRVVSDTLESNGSSSMAAICGGTLALMDAGEVPVVAPVAGIAMGLVKEGDSYAILTDIAGAEDHYGDMDFKVAGTKDGITALQMDIKVPNVTQAILKEALEQARRVPAVVHILDKMTAVIASFTARFSRLTLPASSPCRSPPTRSAS